MESMLWNKFRNRCPFYYKCIQAWKSKLKPKKEHWLLAIFYLLLMLGIKSIFSNLPLVNLFNSFLGLVPLLLIALFYFFVYRYLKIKRLSDFLPFANAVIMLFFSGFLIVLLFVPFDFFSFGLSGKILYALITAIGLYLGLIFSGMGLMAIFIKNFKVSFLKKTLAFGLICLLITPLISSIVDNLVLFTLEKQWLSILEHWFFYIFNASGVILLITFFLLSSFVFYFKENERKHAFIIALIFLFLSSFSNYFFMFLSGNSLALKVSEAFLWIKLSKPISFALVFFIFSIFSKSRSP